ncbi:MAG: GDSL-type esterase/lipase family protein [Akkermansiaceae bacterium]|nr:GDSL-type esterase/lipase family protein [Akkermansiaceae bacterium]
MKLNLGKIKFSVTRAQGNVKDYRTWKKGWIHSHRKSMLQKLDPLGRVVLLGDSLVMNGEWSELLPGHRVANRGIGGETVDQVAERVEELLKQGFSGLIGMAGVNNLLKGEKPRIVGEQLKDLISTACSHHAPVAWCSILPTGPPRTVSHSQIIETNAIIEELCLRYGAEYWDVYSEFCIDGILAKNCSEDGLHLNGNGYLIFSEFILKQNQYWENVALGERKDSVRNGNLQ